MGQFFKTLSLAPRGIKYKLGVAVVLMSVIPLLVCGYLIVYYIFPTVKSFGDVSLIFVITIFLVLLGFYLARKIIYPIVEITAHAKEIVQGKLGKELAVKEEDEIGQLSGSLNRLSTRLKENMSELHSYGEKIKSINMEINKKVFALSSLLQIGNFITTAVALDEVFDLIVEKLAQLETGGRAFIMFMDKNSQELIPRAQSNIETGQMREVKIKIGQGALGKVFQEQRSLIIDNQKRPKEIEENLGEIFQVRNLAVFPVTSCGQVVGILAMGNNAENFLFTADEIELIEVFAKQVAVALENDMLLHKTEELTVRDELTGLYNESYIRSRLDEEIKRAISYQRPCSFIIFEVDNFKQYREVAGEIPAEKTLKRIARCLKEGVSEIDKASRLSDNQFALVLPEKNKRQSLKLAQNIALEIERYALAHTEVKISLNLHGGISATPIDGTTSVELINKALYYMDKAKAQGQNKIITS